MADGARLVVVEGFLKGKEFPLPEGGASIGRLGDNSICLDEPSVSRNHATLKAADGGYTVRDEGSYNGIYFNGQRVESAHLAPGDTFRLGDVVLRIVDDSAPAAPPVPPPAPPPAEVVPVPDAAPAAGLPPAPPAVEAEGGVPGMPGMPTEEGAEPPSGNTARMIGAASGGLVLAGIVAVILLTRGSPPAVEGILMKAGETRLMETSAGPGGKLILFDRVVFENPRDRDLVAAMPFWRRLGQVPTKKQKRFFDILAIRAKREAPGGVTLRLKLGEQDVEVLTVVVRGHMAQPSDKYQGHLTKTEKVRIAEQLVGEANAARATHPYHAIQKYREAIAVTQGERFAPPVQVRAEKLLAAAKRELETVYDHHEFVIWNAIPKRDYHLAAKHLRAIADLVPDPHDWRHQKAKIYFYRIRRRGFLNP